MPLGNKLKNNKINNILSFISLVISITALVIASHVSAKYTKSELKNHTPPVIDPVSVEIIMQDTEQKSKGYDYAILDDAQTSEDIKKETAENKNNDRSLKDTENNIASSNFEKKIRVIAEEESPSEDTDTIISPIKKPKFIREDVEIPTATSQRSDLKKDPNKDSSIIQYNQRKNLIVDNIHKIDNVRSARSESNLKIQLGSFDTHSKAIAGWFRIRNSYLEIFSKLKYHIDKIPDGKNNKELYQLYVNIKDESRAKSICNQIKNSGMDCTVTY